MVLCEKSFLGQSEFGVKRTTIIKLFITKSELRDLPTDCIYKAATVVAQT